MKSNEKRHDEIPPLKSTLFNWKQDMLKGDNALKAI